MAKTEAAPIYMLKRGGHLVPEMDVDAELLHRLPDAERIKVTLHTGRSPSRLRWYWAFLGRVIKATECAPTPEALHDVVKLHTGLVTPVMVKGFTVAIPKSISFSTMSEEEFSGFLDSAVKWIATTYGVTPEHAFDNQSSENPIGRRSSSQAADTAGTDHPSSPVPADLSLLTRYDAELKREVFKEDLASAHLAFKPNFAGQPTPIVNAARKILEAHKARIAGDYDAQQASEYVQGFIDEVAA